MEDIKNYNATPLHYLFCMGKSNRSYGNHKDKSERRNIFKDGLRYQRMQRAINHTRGSFSHLENPA